MVSLNDYQSHPGKSLQAHTLGVLEGVRSRTSLKLAEIAAIFHDLGKINPNFQNKLDPKFFKKFNHKISSDYANHAYLSALSFLCYCTANQNDVLEKFNNKKEWLASVIAIIAHHHGNLPNFPHILNYEECDRLTDFLTEKPLLPISDYLKFNLSHNKFSVTEIKFIEQLCKRIPIQLAKKIDNPLDFYLKTQFSFASVIASDKEDAGGYKNKKELINKFCKQYNNKLNIFIQTLKQVTDINRLRTEMRLESQSNIQEKLKNKTRIFSLTAPTGSGKTIMLLTLAGEILKEKGDFRIIYALPFLSITEQVEKICNKIFEGLATYVRRIDSKSENRLFENIQHELDNKPEDLKKILSEQMAEDTFDYPFIITTFVRLFETMLSNRNSTLLKLPNFSNCIFLIDEIQALPPRLYGFFVALLHSFCRKFNSYAIISTATMPNFELPGNNKHDLKDFFHDYVTPPELLSLQYFKHPIFNRYAIERIAEPVSMESLSKLIANEVSSVLVIMNTIQDTKNLYNSLIEKGVDDKVILLNTHFTPNDRQLKIAEADTIVNGDKKVTLISTQLIEAGVDIDFPVVYRDISPVPSVIQSAGRCNRHGKRKQKGRVVLFDLHENNKSRSTLIYRGKDLIFLNYAKNRLYGKTFHEVDLIEVQKDFFTEINVNTIFGLHQGKRFKNDEIDFIEAIKKAQFSEIGKFRLIDEIRFGEEYRYYIPKSYDDDNYEQLQIYIDELKEIDYDDYENRKIKEILIENQLKKMSGQIVQVRLQNNDVKPIPYYNACCGIYKISKDKYCSKTGIKLNSENQIL